MSSVPQVLDQRVKQLTVGVKQGASYADPPITYDYDLNTELWGQTQLTHAPTLDDIIATHGSTAIQPDHAALLDLEEDGLLDLETAFDQTLIHQNATGFTIESLPATSAPTDPLCRPTPSSLNKPRMLARMHGSAAEPQVMVLKKIGFGGSTRLLVCDRLGVSIYDQT